MNITAKGEAKLPILEQRWKATNTALDILTEIQQILRIIQCSNISLQYTKIVKDASQLRHSCN